METTGHTGRGQLKCDSTRAETRFRLSAKWTSPFKSAGASVQSTTGSRGVRIIGSNAGYTMFRGSVKSTGYPLHSPVSPSLPLPCVTVGHHISPGVYCSGRVVFNKEQVIAGSNIEMQSNLHTNCLSKTLCCVTITQYHLSELFHKSYFSSSPLRTPTPPHFPQTRSLYTGWLWIHIR